MSVEWLRWTVHHRFTDEFSWRHRNMAEQSQGNHVYREKISVDRLCPQARLAWLKQELEIRQQQENKIRHELGNALLDSEADRKYFASELAKREVLIDELAREKNRQFSSTIKDTSAYPLMSLDIQHFQRETSDKMKLLQVGKVRPIDDSWHVRLDSIVTRRRTFDERNRTHQTVANHRNATGIRKASSFDRSTPFRRVRKHFSLFLSLVCVGWKRSNQRSLSTVSLR